MATDSLHDVSDGPTAGHTAIETGPLVSVFTATHDIGRNIDTAWRSLMRQTYRHWEWVIVDDSSFPDTADYIAHLAETPDAGGRIRFFRQHPPPGSVGATKAAAGALCRGELMIELDHDDELTPDALEMVVATFLAHPDIDFVYSDWIDWIDEPDSAGQAALFPSGWAFGLGAYASEIVSGWRVPVALAPPLTWETIRHIVSTPNHLRAWREPLYRRIGGHDHRLPVADDYDLMVRMFLNGTMARIPRPLYIQHHSAAGTNTSRQRNTDIQRLVEQIAARQREALDRRCLSLGVTPRESSPWSSTPIAAASASIDVVAEAAADRGTPLVSVIVPTRNRPDALRRAISSALGQTWQNLEVLVVGDQCAFVNDVIAGIDDMRVRHWNLDEHADDLGATPRNYALKVMARGTLIAYLDDDNWWEPDHLVSLIGALAQNPEASFAFSSFEVAGETITCRRPRRFQIDTSALLHRSFLLDRFGYWRAPSDAGFAHDWELVSRWDGEPWVATLKPTLHYTLETSHQDLESVRMMQSVAEEERRAARAVPST